MASPSDLLNVSAKLSPNLVHQPVPSGILVCSVWEDASVEDMVLAPSVGPAVPPQVVSSSILYLSELSLTFFSRTSTMCTPHCLCLGLLSTLSQTDLEEQLLALDRPPLGFLAVG